MRAFITLTSVALLFLVLVSALPASAQSFEVEIDCEGIFPPGGTVPILVTAENRTFNSILLDVTVSINVPTLGDRTLKQVSTTLVPNQDSAHNFFLHLPPAAPNGRYIMTIVASSINEMTFDTCSFHVQGD